MPTFADSRLPKPSSWDEFEKIVCSVAKIRWNNSDFTRHGRQGQVQSGVDVYGRDENKELIGIQCKNTTQGVTQAVINAEVVEAEKFKPALSKLYIATTADADAKTQLVVREISGQRHANGKFEVFMLFWGDIWDELSRDEARLFQHYPQLRPNATAAVAVPVGLKHDQAVYERFKKELAFDPSIRLLRDHDFGNPFGKRLIEPFFRFVEEWDSPENEFIDLELNEALKKLYGEAKTLSYCLVERVVPVGAGDFLSVYSDQQRAQGPRPDYVIREAKEMNDAASRFIPLYEAFSRLCKSKLAS